VGGGGYMCRKGVSGGIEGFAGMDGEQS